MPNSPKINIITAGVAITSTAFSNILLTFLFYYNLDSKYIIR